MTLNKAPWVLGVGAFAAACLSAMPPLALTIFATAIAAAIALNHNCKLRRQTLLRYELCQAQTQTWSSLQDGLSALAAAKAIWRVDPGSPATSRTGARAGATDTPFITSDLAFPGITGGADTFHFLPDHLLIRTRNFYAPIGYGDIDVQTSFVNLVETSWVPADAVTVGRTWKHAKRDGGPDRRYKYNPEHPIIRYVLVTLKMNQYRLGLLVSDLNRAYAFAAALRNAAAPAAPHGNVVADSSPAKPAPSMVAAVPDPVLPASGPPRHAEPVKTPISEAARWIGAGQSVRIAGFEIPGMIYYGRAVRALNGFAPEPALIDPSKPVAQSSEGFEPESVPYWPSYSEISPAARQAYLSWHANGRSSPSAPISFVFLHFYGLERRLLGDLGKNNDGGEDYDHILDEVRRLIGIYELNASFRGYAWAFLEVAEALRLRPMIDASPPEFHPTGYDFPARLRIALGRMAVAGQPVPPAWARAWAIAAPTFSRRTPFQRCGQYFSELFESRYTQRFGAGVLVKPNKTLIRLEYRPASASFGGPVSFKLDIPDVTVLKEPIGRLQELAEECTNELDAYSRYLGRNPNGDRDITALSLLPAPLLSTAQTGHARVLRDKLAERIGDGVLLTRTELLALAEVAETAGFAKRDAVALAQALAAMGFGVEPDVRFGGPVPSAGMKVHLFPLAPTAASAPTPAYSAATLLIHLAALVSAADGKVSREEEEHLQDHIAASLHLSEGERCRLHAHLRWVLAERPGLAGLNNRIESLALPQRQAIGRFLVGVANVDGHVSPDEVEMLGKMYRMLGLNPQDVYRHAHEAATDPVTVMSGEAGAGGFVLPPRRRIAKPSGVSLNAEVIEAKLKETAAVSALLASVFGEETATDVAALPKTDGGRIAGFDSEGSAFVKLVATKGVWSRGELELIATQRAILLDGTIEAINEAAFDLCDQPALEGDDPVEANIPVLTTLLERTVPE